MSEEEKKAIKMIKEQKEDAEHGIRAMECTPEDYDEDIYNDYVEWSKNANTILNLIEKQNNRLEQLEKENEQHKQLNVGIMTDLINDFIPKSVIREKIEELKQQTSTINDKAISKKYSHTQFARECCIGMLKELLG